MSIINSALYSIMLNEMQKLFLWLKEHADDYGWMVGIELLFDTPQLIVFDKETNERLWDAICHKYSYGGERGLLEIMGEKIVDEEKIGNTVEGFLTCDDVIDRIHRAYGNKEDNKDEKLHN